MKQKIYQLIVCGILLFGLCQISYSQVLFNFKTDQIEKEITQVFEKSIKAGENLNVDEITAPIDDSLKAGFIDNGNYFESFEDLMVGFKKGIQGLEWQKMNVETKKITVLSDNHALLTAKGNYSAKVADGLILKGKFAWSFVYARIKGDWKVIHSHMSNPG
jgi:hypothetical protein